MFLHKVIAGAADRSYGVHVARLAGLPDNVLHRAEQILSQLEAGQHGAADAAELVKSLPLFDHAQPWQKLNCQRHLMLNLPPSGQMTLHRVTQ